jgi:hypothetical protein
MVRKLFLLGMLIVLLLPIVPRMPTALAQGENYCDSLSELSYGGSAVGRINDSTYVAGYCFFGEAGDRVIIDVVATTGNLDTLIGLYDPFAETLFAENDDVSDNNTNSQIAFTLPEDGQYLILITRYDLEAGTTSGSFQLSLSLGTGGTKNPGGDDDLADPSEVITITCDTGETLYGGMQFGFINIVPGFSYTVTVFGIDDFDPVVAVETSRGIGECNDDESLAAGSFASIPGEGTVRANRQTAQVRFNLSRAGSPVITVGSFDGQGGTYAMVIEGLAISPSTEADGFVIRVPTAVALDPLSVYMIARFTDLDPYLQLAAGEGLDDAFGPDGEFDPDFIDYNNAFIAFECDDAGDASNCGNDTPELSGGGIDIANGSTYITGSVDAGIRVIPETTDPLLYIFSSNQGRSAGTYAILIIGSAPSVAID